MNLIIAEKKTNNIFYFIKDAKIKGDRVIGSNISLSGMKKKVWTLKWTYDEISPIIGLKGRVIGWSKNFDEIIGEKYDQKKNPSRFKDFDEDKIVEEIEAIKNLDDVKDLFIELLKYTKHLVKEARKNG